MPSYHWRSTERLTDAQLAQQAAPFMVKIGWFVKHGYKPHYWQLLFHTMRTGDELTRFRHLVAGRRGGKTLSAAWEVLFYVLHPEFFHLDSQGKRSDRALWVWQLSKDYKLGFPALNTFRQVLGEAGLVNGKDYTEHKGDKLFTFNNGSVVQFKSADDPESLRGAGLDILWIDEAAFIPNRDAYDRVYPALSDKLGHLITTTTPDGKNWFYDEFGSDAAMADEDNGRVEYTSIHNPYFPQKEWLRVKARYHPLLFKQEYMASFDSMAGKELQGEWLHYYSPEDLPRDKDGKRLELSTYLGVDPAISLSEKADRFAMTLIGVTKDSSQVYLLDQWAGRVPFPEQVDLIQQWHLKYRPMLIGVEAVAYQAALAQQVSRLASLPPIVPMLSKGKKLERILSMAPLFKIGRVRIRREHTDFINEWIDYDPELKNPKDDCLDSMEIALRTAGALLPEKLHAAVIDPNEMPATDIQELAVRHQPGSSFATRWDGVDYSLGSEW